MLTLQETYDATCRGECITDYPNENVVVHHAQLIKPL